MSLSVLAAVGALGGFGAIARMVLDGAVSDRVVSMAPWGTLAVNLSGAFALGVLIGAGVDGDALRLAGGGLLGAYTTLSTWMLQTRVLLRAGRRRTAVTYVVASLVLGFGAIAAGRGLA